MAALLVELDARKLRELGDDRVASKRSITSGISATLWCAQCHWPTRCHAQRPAHRRRTFARPGIPLGRRDRSVEQMAGVVAGLAGRIRASDRRPRPHRVCGHASKRPGSRRRAPRPPPSAPTAQTCGATLCARVRAGQGAVCYSRGPRPEPRCRWRPRARLRSWRPWRASCRSTRSSSGAGPYRLQPLRTSGSTTISNTHMGQKIRSRPRPARRGADHERRHPGAGLLDQLPAQLPAALHELGLLLGLGRRQPRQIGAQRLELAMGARLHHGAHAVVQLVLV